MTRELSPQNEQFLADIVAGGLFPSKEAALDAEIESLREKTERLATISQEHVELVEQGIASARAGRKRELTDADWEKLRQRAHDVAARNQASRAKITEQPPICRAATNTC
jgi:hypothetical protein